MKNYNKIQNKIYELGETFKTVQSEELQQKAVELIIATFEILNIRPDDFEDIPKIMKDALFNDSELNKFISVFITDMIKKGETT